MFLFWVAKGISAARVSLTSGECWRDAHYKKTKTTERTETKQPFFHRVDYNQLVSFKHVYNS